MSSRYGLKVGQVVKVEVVELQSGGDILVQYSGHLIRVKNSTAKRWQPLDKLKLIVQSLNPLEFQIYKRNNDSLDRFA